MSFIQSGIRPLILGCSGQGFVHTGTLVETNAATVVIPAGCMGTKGAVRFSAFYTYTNNGNAKRLRVRVGGMGGTNLINTSPTTTDALQTELTLWADNSLSAQKYFTSTFPYTSVAVAKTSLALDMSVDQALVFPITLTNIGDTVILESYYVELLRSVP